MRRHISSKWLKTKVLMKRKSIRSFIPETRKMTRSNFQDMLKRHQMIYIKPVKGMHGNGVIRVERKGNAHYQYRFEKKTRSFSTLDCMYQSIIKRTKGKPYLVQKGIHLLKFNRRPFDIRVLVQKNLQNRWEYTGMIGRVAPIGKVVTNVHNGGMVRAVSSLLSPHLNLERRKALTKRLNVLGMDVARSLENQFPGIKEIGLDIGIDVKGSPWIIEVNTTPDLSLFKAARDRRIFDRIVKYGKAYGRL